MLKIFIFEVLLEQYFFLSHYLTDIFVTSYRALGDTIVLCILLVLPFCWKINNSFFSYFHLNFMTIKSVLASLKQSMHDNGYFYIALCILTHIFYRSTGDGILLSCSYPDGCSLQGVQGSLCYTIRMGLWPTRGNTTMTTCIPN